MNSDKLPCWEAFCDALAAVGQLTPGRGFPTDTLSLGDGFSHLGQLLSASLAWHLGGNDPDRPRFVQINDTPEVADNLFAAIRGDAVYRLRGSIPWLFEINISVHEGWNFRGKPRVWGDLGRADLDIDANGNFDLVLGGEPRSGNWLALPPEAAFLHIREYYYDFERDRPGSFEIERLDAPTVAAQRESADQVGAQLQEAVAWVDDYVRFHHQVFERRHRVAPNSVTAPARQPAGNRHIWYGFGKFKLESDEALLLEFAAPSARMWSVQWLTSPWYETAGLIDRLTGLVGSEAQVGSDGIVRIVFAASDPGVRNWLDIDGYREGFFVTRWIWCEQGPEPSVKVVPLAELDTHLPADEPRLNAEERPRQIARRRAHFLRRRR